MPDYRLYLVGIAGAVVRVIEIEAVDDAAAIRAATAAHCANRMELWCGPRFVNDRAFTMPKRAVPIEQRSRSIPGV